MNTVAPVVYNITVTVALDSTISGDVTSFDCFCQLGPTFQRMQRNVTAIPLANAVTPTKIFGAPPTTDRFTGVS
jgi:hypothetical protein